MEDTVSTGGTAGMEEARHVPASRLSVLRPPLPPLIRRRPLSRVNDPSTAPAPQFWWAFLVRCGPLPLLKEEDAPRERRQLPPNLEEEDEEEEAEVVQAALPLNVEAVTTSVARAATAAATG